MKKGPKKHPFAAQESGSAATARAESEEPQEAPAPHLTDVNRVVESSPDVTETVRDADETEPAVRSNVVSMSARGTAHARDRSVEADPVTTEPKPLDAPVVRDTERDDTQHPASATEPVEPVAEPVAETLTPQDPEEQAPVAFGDAESNDPDDSSTNGVVNGVISDAARTVPAAPVGQVPVQAPTDIPEPSPVTSPVAGPAPTVTVAPVVAPTVQVRPSLASLTPPAPAAPSDTMMPSLTPPPPGSPASQTRLVSVSKRGKRDFNYSWPKADVAVMNAALEEYKPLYRRYWDDAAPGGSYRLGFSAFVARALQEAFKDPDAWLHTVRNDARKEPVAGERKQVGLVWPVEVEKQVIDLWERLDKSRFPAGFSLTKQHLAAAAILHGLKSAHQWVLSVGNDDRFTIPVPTDGRLRTNRATDADLEDV